MNDPRASRGEDIRPYGKHVRRFNALSMALTMAIDVCDHKARRIGARHRHHLHCTRGRFDGGWVQQGAARGLVEHEAAVALCRLRERPADRVGSRCIPGVPHLRVITSGGWPSVGAKRG